MWGLVRGATASLQSRSRLNDGERRTLYRSY